MRLTKQKQAILEELQKHKDHPVADVIYSEVRKVLPRISLGTVYRNLENMSEQGLILKIEQAGGQKRFDPNPNPHPHFRCVNCGAVEDVPIEIDVVGLSENSKWAQNRKVYGNNIEIYGLCEKCNSERNSK